MKVVDLTTKLISTGVERSVTAAARAGSLAKGFIRLYNRVADVIPVPLPRIGPEGNGYEPPSARWTPPPPPSRPAPLSEPAPTPKAVIDTSSGLTVEKHSPKKATAPKKAAVPKKAAAPKKAEALSGLTKADLKTRLDAAGLKHTSKMTKSQLIALLNGEDA